MINLWMSSTSSDISFAVIIFNPKKTPIDKKIIELSLIYLTILNFLTDMLKLDCRIIILFNYG
jgi:hypothetical protein